MSSDLSDYLVLARKYRPQRLADLVGQEHVAETLRKAIASGRIAHAFLFTGIRGVGKTTAARLLARALNCERAEQPTPDPCGECSNCIEIRESRSADVAEIDGASNRGIDAIRELTESVRYRPLKSRFRVYIIDEAHMVTREGFNALLKTLEEPPPHVKFVFATTAVEKFPPTIVSRCQRYDFKRIPLGRIREELRRIADREEIEITDPALYMVAREGQGSMRDAESLLERLMAYSGTKIDDAKIGEILGVADRRSLVAAADAILAGDAKVALEIVDGIHGAGRDLERFSRDLLELWRNLVVTKLSADGAILSDVPEEEIAEYRRQAELRSMADLQRLFRIARLGDEELERSPYPRLVLEMTLVRQATAAPVVPVDEVFARLDEIERGLGRPPAKTTRTAPAPTADAAQSRAAVQGNGAAAAAAKPSPPPPAEEKLAAPAASGGRSWEEFLAFVHGRGRIALHMNLAHARFLGVGGGSLVLGVAKEKFRNELASRASLGLTEQLASEFFGAPCRVRIESVADEAASPAAQPSRTETLENPTVRAAVSILGGEVREVRNRR
ncbi:MAG: DNA polymerase III subunit gamma/tau [Candidatus Binatia bacterium]